MDMLNGKAIIVTGAAQGIGAAMAAGFAEMGAQVALSDIDDAGDAAERINGTGGRAIAVQADVTSLAGCDEMVARAEEAFGRLDGLVCNAALFSVLPIQDFDEIEPDLWDQVMAVNVKGPWLCTRAAAPAMERSGGGSIVMIATNRVFHGFPGLLHYDASKGGVLAMTRSLIRELGSRNIRVNTIAPGLTMTEGVLARKGIEDRKAAIVAGRSIARDMQPDDLIGPTAFFLSDHAAFVSGQSLGVDGGGVIH
ncbi:MAG: SDR family oxidoreductase [Boseongicola sp. SB0675_bin_26]|nr:SDR family oxidoreductase [Boseongicola sp. SB0675_bin_26]